MSFFDKVIEFVSGGIGEKIVDTVKEYFPPKLTEAERMQLEQVIRQAARQHELQLLALAQEEQIEFTQRIKAMEGTAKDLQAFGVLGKAVVFMRGMQRPVWGFFVLWMDINVFSGKWKLSSATIMSDGTTLPMSLESAFWLINFLVLGFLFGERAMKNVLPLMHKRFGGNAQLSTTSHNAQG